jgi:hypothetical protein
MDAKRNEVKRRKGRKGSVIEKERGNRSMAGFLPLQILITVLYCTLLYVLYLLYSTVLYCIVLYCIVLL